MTDAAAAPSPAQRGALALAALGVVFGDIGTSPLYTLHECIGSEHGVAATADNILGLLSLIVWSLTLVVTMKYVSLIMRADNRGEGGIFALLALIPRARKAGGQGLGWTALLVIIGAALLYGDGMITPAISVLSAIEGLEIAAPGLRSAVLPVTCAVLVGLFAIQSRGTGSVGRLFGPVMALWFGTLALLGIVHIVANPSVMAALNPWHAARFFAAHGWHGLAVLGSVVLAVTGAEALYADMGHFGRGPIRLAWFAAAMPALVLNYFGQGALMLKDPAATQNPFFALVPPGLWTYALVGLATAATVIASQALISGAFSLTHQAVQLGFFPRVTVKHTSRESEGQIYIPEINWGIAVVCVALVLGFQHSSRLAGAYGIAVTGTMLITSIIFFEVTRTTWGWSLGKALPLLLLFLCIDLPFFAASLLKFFDGGFVPVLLALGFTIVMLTWRTGRRIYRQHVTAVTPALPAFLAACRDGLGRIPGAGIFVTGRSEGVPPILVHLAERLRVLPETIVLLTVDVMHAPHAPPDGMRCEPLGAGVYRLVVQRGFMDDPNVPRALALGIPRFGLPIDLAQVSYYVGRETFLATEAGRMGRWSEGLFAFLSRNAKSAADHFGIPPQQVVEIGTQIDL
jgi:KUP system potassium uptake protein